MSQARPDRDRIIEMAKAGVQPREIAHDLGIEANAVSCILWYERQKGADIPRFRSGPWIGQSRLVVNDPGGRLRRGLSDAAGMRGLTEPELARRLLCAAVRDDLVDAILDDGGDDAG